MWLGIGYLVCMLLCLIYILNYVYSVYPKELKRKVRLNDIYIGKMLLVMLFQPIGLLAIIIDTINEYFKKRGK